MNQLPANFRRLIGLSIPIASALGFFGIITSITKINMNENILSTPLTLNVILALSQVGLWWMIYKRRIP